VLVVNSAVPANNIAELIKLAKDKPGGLNYASAGVGTPAHLAGEMLNLLAEIKVTHVPYKGAAPALQDVIAGNAQYIITSPIAAGAPHAAADACARSRPPAPSAIRACPICRRSADTVPGYEITQSWGIVAPAGTPPEIVNRLATRSKRPCTRRTSGIAFLRQAPHRRAIVRPRSRRSWRRSGEGSAR
jgi:tripartite-type tricarboxylate transporter receptor subunit TctC